MSTEKFGEYEVQKREDGSLLELGRGAMGITYKAFDTHLQRFVALKTMSPSIVAHPEAEERFIREARSAAHLRHPNIAEIFRRDKTPDGLHYFAMEFCEGQSVEELVKQEGPLGWKRALGITAQAANALAAAARKNLIHRDIKPANLMLVLEDEAEVLKVIDFGLSKMTLDEGGAWSTMSTKGFIGTAHFASPEQIKNESLDVRSDIYSLGATLWFMLRGSPPFTGSIWEVVSKQVTETPEFSLLAAPATVVSLVRRMMEKDPSFRPQTATELLKEITWNLQLEWQEPAREDQCLGRTRGPFREDPPEIRLPRTAPQSEPPVRKSSSFSGKKLAVAVIGGIAGTYSLLIKHGLSMRRKVFPYLTNLSRSGAEAVSFSVRSRSQLSLRSFRTRVASFVAKVLAIAVTLRATTSRIQPGILKARVAFSLAADLARKMRVVQTQALPPRIPPPQNPADAKIKKLTKGILTFGLVATGVMPFALILIAGSLLRSGVSAKSATKEAPFENSLKMKFVPVEITGGPTNGKRVLFSVWDTRVQDYAEYSRDKGLTPERPSFNQGPTHPVVMVSWEDASSFCAWLTAKERASGKIGSIDEYRLPSDHEWSCAVGVGRNEDADAIPASKTGKVRAYPWGAQWPPPKGFGNYSSFLHMDEFDNTSPVGSFPANLNGLYDMGGNVWQWCADWYSSTHENRVLRGGSWFSIGENILLSTHRQLERSDYRGGGTGFRCVLLVASR